jgi:hypothetical protein
MPAFGLKHSKEIAMFMTDEEICDYYDSHPDLLLSQLSRMTGKSVQQLKRILMPDFPDYEQSN